MCVNLYLCYLNDYAIQYNLAFMLHEQISIAFVSSYIHICRDVIVVVNSKKAEVNAVENSKVF